MTSCDHDDFIIIIIIIIIITCTNRFI